MLAEFTGRHSARRTLREDFLSFPEKSVEVDLKDGRSLWSVDVCVCVPACLQMKYNNIPLRHLGVCVCARVCVNSQKK